MAEGSSFDELIRRVRAGEAGATEELVRRYEPSIRLVVRARLTDPNLRRLFDSMDICQSVFASFFLRAAAGEYQLEQPAQLIRLLETMARNKLIKQAEKEQAGRRDCRRRDPAGLDEGAVAADDPSPSAVVSHRELLSEFRRRLSESERQLAEYRALNLGWAEIAAKVGGHPDALRMQLTRAVDRICQELGLEQ